MTTIKGQTFLTVRAEAGEVYEIKYSTPPRISMLNNTSGEVKISSSEEFAENGASGLYLTIPQNWAVNDIAVPFETVYIKAEASGNIVIERCG
ncbi:MAG: hypothetical protein J1G06_04590 [Oscillospiraceae bacterium]|nr:hypothetical protein [Oscillospiraceae bacterium]